MIIVMQKSAPTEEVQRILELLESAGARGHVSTSDLGTVIGIVGEREVIAGLPLEAYPGVDKVLPILQPYKLVSREFRRSDTIITVGGTRIGGEHVALITGPCSVESRSNCWRQLQPRSRLGPPCCAGARTNRAPPRMPSRGWA